MITAKVQCFDKKETQVGDQKQATIRFCPDYSDGRNKEWATSTPSLELRMTVNGDVADRFEPLQAYLLTFTPEPTQAEDQS